MPYHVIGIRLTQLLFLAAALATAAGYGGLGVGIAVAALPVIVVTVVLWIAHNRRVEREARAREAAPPAEE